MFFTSPKFYHLFLRNVPRTTSQKLNISTSVTNYANHYEVLGISKNSTQGEIKAAYYRLSMLYHPDKNQGSKTAAVKFTEINQAYEVLGNFRLRRLYDKGIIHTAGSQYAEKAQDMSGYGEPEVEDDPSTKFYKSRFKKSTVADTEGRTPIYDFDEWSRQHYGKTFQRRQTAKAKYERTQTQETDQILMTQKEVLLCAMLFLGVLVYMKFHADSSYDTPKEKAHRVAEDKTRNNPEKDSTT